MADYYAIGQCTPGAIAVNVSTFIGYKIKGILGGIVATLGFVFPALIVIFVIATILNNFMDIAQVKSAFAAIRVCVFVLILSAILKLSKKSVVDVITLIVAALILFLSIFVPVIPLYSYVIVAGIIGIIVGLIRQKKDKDEAKKTLEELKNKKEEEK